MTNKVSNQNEKKKISELSVKSVGENYLRETMISPKLFSLSH